MSVIFYAGVAMNWKKKLHKTAAALYLFSHVSVSHFHTYFTRFMIRKTKDKALNCTRGCMVKH